MRSVISCSCKKPIGIEKDKNIPVKVDVPGGYPELAHTTYLRFPFVCYVTDERLARQYDSDEVSEMLGKRIEDLLNDQIKNEFYSAYLYMSMSAWLNNYGLNGYAHWFRVQAQEERDHALIFLNFIIKANGRVHLYSIDEPNFEFKDIGELLDLNLSHEQ